MAPKKMTRGKKTVARAKATRKSSLRSERKAPRGGSGSKAGGGGTTPDPIQFP